MIAGQPPPDPAALQAQVLGLYQTQLANWHVAMATASRLAPAAFCAYVLRDEEKNTPVTLASHHEQWHGMLDRHPRVLIWSSIESGKTQQISVGRVLWELGKNPNLRVLVLSATDTQAVKIATTLRRYIEQSAELRRVFPGLLPGKENWTESAFTVQRSTMAKDPSVQAAGVHSRKLLGSRVDLLVVDDVLNIENASTPYLRAGLISWMKATPFGRLTAQSRVWVVGTAFHKEDLLHHLAGQPDFAPAALRWPIVVRDAAGVEQSQWPARWPMSRVAAKKQELGPLEFARQLLCEARDDGQARFKREWIDRAKAAGDGKRMAYQLAHVPQGYRVVTGVDLAVQQHSAADLTAMTTVIFHPGAHREVLSVESGRWTGPEIVQRLVDLARRYNGVIAVENNAAQDFIRQFAAGAGIQTVPVTTGRNKLHPEFGVEGIAIELARGDWIFPTVAGRGEAELEALCGEMLWYDPREHTGDRLMSMWVACEGWRLTQASPTRNEQGRLWLAGR